MTDAVLRGDTDALPVLPVIADEDLPVLPVVGDERMSAIRGLLSSLGQYQTAEGGAGVSPRKKYQRRSALQQLLRDLRSRGPSWIGSTIAHAFVLFVMAQFVMFIRDPDAVRSILITLSQAEAEEAGESAQPDERGTEEAPAPAGEPEEAPPDDAPEAAEEPAAAPMEQADDRAAAEPAAATEPQPQNARPAEAEVPPAPETSSEAASSTETIGPKVFHNRSGAGKTQALNKYGGSAETEEAVERGLRWLAEHQQPDGRWSGASYSNRCPAPGERWAGRSVSGNVKVEAPCPGPGRNGYDVAHTGLAALCFLGAGHLPGSKPYGDHVGKALKYLTGLQRADGGFDGPKNHSCMYNQGIATLALCEASALTSDKALSASAQRAVDYLAKAQTSSGGWDYTGAGVRTRRSDMSISGWVIMAMKSALAADLIVSRKSWDRARKYVRRSQRGDGEYSYDTTKGRYGPAMTAAGLACDLYLGTDPNLRGLGLAERRIARETPSWDRLIDQQSHTVYYWYYGTLAMFQRGGKPWTTWNTAMRTTLLSNQRKGGHADGSWDPAGPWLGRHGGRTYATALNVLSLEIYYRYLPVYRGTGAEIPPDLAPARVPSPNPVRRPSAYEIVDAADAMAKVKAEAPAMRASAVARLAKEKNAKAFAAIKRSLRDRDQMVRYAAVQALTTRAEPEATWLLVDACATESRDMRRVVVRALGKRGDRAAVPALIAALSDADRALRAPARRALEQLTQQKFGDNARAWSRWWGAQRRK